MKKALALILAAAMSCSLFLTGCGGGNAAAGSASTGAAAGAQSLTLATGGTTGTYYAVGGVMSTVLNKKLTNSSLTVTSTGASKANIQLLADGEANLAIVQNDVMHYAATGTDLFEAEGKYESFSSVCGMYDETIQLVTTNANIKSVTDLKGKTVCVGDAGSGTEFNAKQVLAAYGMSFDDITVNNASFGDSADSLKDGKIDAAFVAAGAPTTAVVDLSTAAQVYIVPIDGAERDSLMKDYAFYTKTTIPANTYKGQDADVETVSVRATLIAADDLSEDVVYELVKAMFDNQEELVKGHEKFNNLKLEDATKGIDVKFHPGAAKYFKEKGIDVA
jgi:uncharacterized protein